ncbi:MAG: AraC family transcriptional regulator [Candidatus Aminicenantes bacterium]|nr:AraC family transcriptional regulator [Candidatus Aminicenantes bacterium]
MFFKVYWLHFIVFVLFCITFYIKYQLWNADLIREKLQTGTRFTPVGDQLLGLAEYLQFMVYTVASILILRKYRKKIKEVYSSIESINLSWLNFVVFGFPAWKSLCFINEIIWYATGRSGVFLYVIYISAEGAFLTFVCIMFLKGIRQPVIFSGQEEEQARKKYKKTLLSEEQKEKYKNKLIDFMKSQKPYLNPSLSLSELAGMISLPAYQLSQVINSCFHKNFYDFINSYRVRESQRLLSEPPQDQKTVLEILYETGFNSKSVFNSAFRKFTGMTPSQFRKVQNS